MGEKVGDSCEKMKVYLFSVLSWYLRTKLHFSTTARDAMLHREHTELNFAGCVKISKYLSSVSCVPALFVQLSRPPGEVAVSL